MNQNKTNNALPEALVHTKKGFSLVWVIPIVAVLIAAGLVYKAVTEKGPVVTIRFDSAEGLEAGKTKVRYKDVVVGEVTGIQLSSDLKDVVVTAELVRGAYEYLTEGTRFWVVKARLSGGAVSGLGTLFSGSYIAMDPNHEGESRYDFTGLATPPVVSQDSPGRYFRLKAARLGSLEHGSPIYYKGVKVGQVVGYQFSDRYQGLEIDVFIRAPFHEHVFETSRFWLTSGIDISLDANGMRIDTPSLAAMVIGGLAFDNPDHVKRGALARDGFVFPLFGTSDDALAMKFAQKEYFLLRFEGSARGLSMGAPVEFRGFPFGRVVDIGVEMDWGNRKVNIPVKIEVEPGRIEQLMNDSDIPADGFHRLVDWGLRAQLKTGNLITGQKYVALDFFEHASPVTVVSREGLMEIPTVPESIDNITQNLALLMDKFSKLPVAEIGSHTLEAVKSYQKAGDGLSRVLESKSLEASMASLNRSLEQVQRLTAKLEKDLPLAIDKASEETVAAMAGIQNLTARDSELVFELRRVLQEFSKAAQSISRLADHLERHPESIIQGKGREK